MPIRDIVTRGFGNGTFSPGVNRLPTRGYSIAAVEVDPVVYCAHRAAAFAPGAMAGTLCATGADLANVFTPGAKAGQVC